MPSVRPVTPKPNISKNMNANVTSYRTVQWKDAIRDVRMITDEPQQRRCYILQIMGVVLTRETHLWYVKVSYQVKKNV